MNNATEFLRECGAFMLLTVNDGKPAGRPFGAVTEIDGELYVSIGEGKAVFMQIMKNPNVQLVALKSGTRDWVRISGIAEECFDHSAKKKMLRDCPNLLNHYTRADDEKFHLFRIRITASEVFF